jgi:hypothetical protein
MLMDVSEVRDRDSSSEPEQRANRGGPLTTAEAAECTCPDFCERDHDID